MKILISVPHAKCPKNKDDSAHHCDVAAQPVANNLKKKLEQLGHEVIVILGDKLRHQELDLNRPESRDSEFRTKLNELLKDSDLLIDCHSFPKNSMKYSKWELVVFKSPYDKNDSALHLFQILKNLNLNVAFQPAFTRDSILNDAVKQGFTAVLIEHNEDLDIDMITDFEADAINQFLTGIKPDRKSSIVKNIVRESFK